MSARNIIDDKFLKCKGKYLFQTVLSTSCILAVLSTMNFMAEGAIVSSFGATAFIVFSLPKSPASSVKKVLGGYITGVVSGYLFHKMALVFTESNLIIFIGLAVGFSFFVMVILDMEHPPAAGMALGLVMDGFNLKVVFTVISGVIMLLLLKAMLKKFMINLI